MIAAIDQFIQNCDTKNIKITNHHLEVNVVKKGDNFMSGIIRLRFDSNKSSATKWKSVILKIPSLSAIPFAVLKNTNLFDREAHIYTKVLPELYRLGKCKPFAPLLFASTPAGALVLEDLTIDGYKPGDKLRLCDINEAMSTLNVLAIYHATGYVYLQTLSKDDPSWSLIGSNQPVLLAMKSRTKKPTFDKFCEMIQPHLSESLYQRILKLENEIPVDPEIKISSQGNSIIVMRHADMRANNILHKYNDEGISTQAKLIDFQDSREGSPVLDLIYYFVTSVSEEVFEANENKLLTNYLDKLNAHLRSMGSSCIYKSEDLDRDFDNYKNFYLTILGLILPKFMGAGSPGEMTDLYVSRTIKWLNYLEKKKFI